MSITKGKDFKMTLKTKLFLKLHLFFHKLDQWFITHCDYEKEKKKIFYAEVKGWPEKWEHKPPPRIPKPRKAIHQDVGKFMRHGRQAPWYRRSVKARKKPEEED